MIIIMMDRVVLPLIAAMMAVLAELQPPQRELVLAVQMASP
jgi:hypothetical protein